MAPLGTTVVDPVDAVSLLGAIEAAKAKLIIPVLVGPEPKIRAAAEQAKLDLGEYEIVPTEHSHVAAAQAVALARDHKVEALMKGNLRTDAFMHAIVAEETLRTDLPSLGRMAERCCGLSDNARTRSARVSVSWLLALVQAPRRAMLSRRPRAATRRLPRCRRAGVARRDGSHLGPKEGSGVLETEIQKKR